MGEVFDEAGLPAHWRAGHDRRCGPAAGAAFISFSLQPERLALENIAASQLIVRAYQVQPFQVAGGPWDVFHLVNRRADGKRGEGVKPAAVDCVNSRGGPGRPGEGGLMMMAQAAKGPIEMIVIDRIEQPTED